MARRLPSIFTGKRSYVSRKGAKPSGKTVVGTGKPKW